MPIQFPSQTPSTRSDPTSSQWHLWAQLPPDPTCGKVRCRRGAVESLVEANYSGPGWPLPGIRWEETGRCKPLRRDG